MKRIFFTVTNDLSFDQRMHRICGSLATAGYAVTLVGRELRHSLPLAEKNFQQVRLKCLFNSGILFYAEYNLRLFFFLRRQQMDAVCAIDLDTILPCLFVSGIKKITRIYDAHEYFTELKEVRTRPFVKRCWKAIERYAVPKFKYGYTVSQGLADSFRNDYGLSYEVIRNMPVLTDKPVNHEKQPYLYYQGAVNEARGFEYLVPAMKKIPWKLVICGDGNFMSQLKSLIKEHGVADKVELKGMMQPEDMWPLATAASLGMGLAEKEGINQFLALPNKFFDYMHAGLPQLAMDYPEYRKVNKDYKIAVLLQDLDPETIASTINSIMNNQELLEEMRQNCLKARTLFNWQSEEQKLLQFYNRIFNG